MISARAARWYSCASRCIRSTSSAALWRTSRAPCSASAQPSLGALAGLGLADPGLLEEAFGLAPRGLAGAGGVRLRLGEHGLGLLAHPGRLRLGLGEPVAALGRRAAEQGLRAVPVASARARRAPGGAPGPGRRHPPRPGRGSRAPCPAPRPGAPPRRRRARSASAWASPRMPAASARARRRSSSASAAGPVLARARRSASRAATSSSASRAGGGRILLASRDAAARGRRRSPSRSGASSAACASCSRAPPLLVGPLLLGQAGHRALVLEPGPLEQLVGPRPGVGQLGLRLLLGDARPPRRSPSSPGPAAATPGRRRRRA